MNVRNVKNQRIKENLKTVALFHARLGRKYSVAYPARFKNLKLIPANHLDKDYKWLLPMKDNYSNFIWTRAFQNKSSNEVSSVILGILLQIQDFSNASIQIMVQSSKTKYYPNY